MAVAGHLYKLAFGGPLFTEEQWSCSIHILATDPMTETPESFEDALRAWFISSTASISSAAQLTWIKFNEINPVTGKYLSEIESNTFDTFAPMVGIGATGPGQNTLAISWMTAATRGLASKGRIFPPTGQLVVNMATGQVTTVIASNAAGAANSLLTVINGFGAAQVVVFSKQGQVTRTITGVRVGTIVDTQRRRRSSLKENYQAVVQPG